MTIPDNSQVALIGVVFQPESEKPWLVQDNRKALKNEFPCSTKADVLDQIAVILDDMHNPSSKLDQGSEHMPKLNIPVQFTGVVRVEVPNHLSRTDAKLLATKLALARILATTDNPDAPEDDVFSDYADECSDLAQETAEDDWDRSEVKSVSGSWTATI